MPRVETDARNQNEIVQNLVHYRRYVFVHMPDDGEPIAYRCGEVRKEAYRWLLRYLEEEIGEEKG
jgi:hypothetical protein